MNTEEYYLSEFDISWLHTGNTIEMITKQGNLVKLIPPNYEEIPESAVDTIDPTPTGEETSLIAEKQWED